MTPPRGIVRVFWHGSNATTRWVTFDPHLPSERPYVVWSVPCAGGRVTLVQAGLSHSDALALGRLPRGDELP